MKNEYADMGAQLGRNEVKQLATLESKVGLKEYIGVKTWLNQVEHDLDYSKNYFKINQDNVLNFLKLYEYVDDKSVIRIKGSIAAQINECNELLLTEMIYLKMFDDLTEAEIVALLAIFINDHGEEVQLIDNTCSNKVINCVKQVDTIRNNMIAKERQLNIPYDDDFWSISYEYIDLAFYWYQGEHINKIIEWFSVDEGTFTKNMVKISNMVADLVALNIIFGNIDIIPKLERIPPILIRDIVTVDSLYISSK
jgi:superfamily II RNA helicase